MMRTIILVLVGLLYTLILPSSEGSAIGLKSDREVRRNKNFKYNSVLEPKYNIPSVERIVNGTEAELGQFPWMVALGIGDSSDPSFICGGSLISNRHVITAAHCLPVDIVRVADLNLDNDQDGAHSFQDNVLSQTAHPQYNANTLENDVAIVKTTRTVTLTDLRYPISLPFKLENDCIEGENVLITGWGTTSYGGNSSPHLLYAVVPVVSLDDCKAAYAQYQQDIDNRNICAGYKQGGTDTCQGDSGGPLMAVRSNTPYVVGITSWGYECARPNYPGVYTRVKAFEDFIKKQLAQ